MTTRDDEAAHRCAVTPTPLWLSSASYWQPAHIVTSAWLEHAPFAFWLVDVIRPHRIVELGTHYGFSFFVFAEAVRRLGLDTEVIALDTWRGDDHAGFYGDEVYGSVKHVAEAEYGDSARLLRGYFSESRDRVADDSVDLLHIDGRHGYEDVKADFESWAGTVRSGGIVLFHDIAEHDRDFGVWRLWEELSSAHPSFTFTHNHGLGVLSLGPITHQALRSIFDADDDETARIRATYERLGTRVTRQAELEAMPAEISSLHDVVGSLVGEISHLTSVVEQRDQVIEEYRRSTSWRLTQPLRALGGVLGRRSR
ncbi:hypothetical protein DCE93_09795 [Agromyces badenianii]|uniref:Class I SAM-dependent methyltransferase n=1 Tax=Agromyces badenianii TaxID=2080742 RepID=A0A2S0WXB5_9MICO|nr:class I SAM-dependent methyltransferase [Agromyces badenianii]AWB95920.1 hypothetical protein DCE93_09795 [Agromyces badenianii]